jgi:hypothetical protein
MKTVLFPNCETRGKGRKHRARQADDAETRTLPMLLLRLLFGFGFGFGLGLRWFNFFHRDTATHDVARGTRAWVVNGNNQTAFLALVLGAFLGHW